MKLLDIFEARTDPNKVRNWRYKLCKSKRNGKQATRRGTKRGTRAQAYAFAQDLADRWGGSVCDFNDGTLG